MSKNNRQAGKQKVMALVAVFLVLAMVLSVAVPIFAASYAVKATTYYEVADSTGAVDEMPETKMLEEDKAVSSNSLTLEAEVGFDGAYMTNRQTPVRVKVYNSGKEFNGSIEVKAYSVLETTYSTPVYTKYSKNINVLENGAEEIELIVFPEAASTYMNIRLVDANGNVVISHNQQATPFIPEQVMTAVLTDNKSSNLDYLKNLEIGEDIYNNRSGYVTNNVSVLEKDDFPEVGAALDAFGAIIIDDFNTAVLSDKQITALANWIENGGLLVVGTGLNAEKTLKGLEGVFDFTFDGYGSALCFGGKANTALISIPDAEATEIQGGSTITRTLDMGEGKIVVHSFALSSDPVASMPNRVEYFSQFYRNTMPDKFSSNRNYEYYPETISSINRLPSIEKDRLMLLLGVLAVYIIVVGPICYLILRKKDKREKGWVVIPAIAVVFSVIIFVISLSSYQKEALLNFTTYTNLDSSNPVTQLAMGIRTPEKGDITISVDEEIYVHSRGYRSYSTQQTTEGLCTYAVESGNMSTEITYFDQPAWEDNSLYTKFTDYSENSIEGDFTIDGSNIVGTVKNNFDFDLFDVIVGFCGQQYVKIGHIEAGGTGKVTIPLNAEEYQKWMDNGYQMVRQLIFGLEEDEYDNSQVFRKGVSATEAFKMENRYNLFNNCVYNRNYDLRNTSFDITVAAFSEKRLLESEKRINGKEVDENWQNLYTKNFMVDLSKVENFNIPYGYVFPVKLYLNNDGNQYWDLYYYQLYTMSSDYLECTYSLPLSENVNSISINWENYDGFNGEPKVYNYANGSWQEIKTADLVNNASDYVSKSGEFKLCSYVYSDTYITLPKISLKGGK